MNFLMSVCAILFPFLFLNLSVFLFYWGVFFVRFILLKWKLRAPFFVFYLPIAVMGAAIGLGLFETLCNSYFNDIRNEYSFAVEGLVGFGLLLGLITFPAYLKRYFRFFATVFELDTLEKAEEESFVRVFIFRILGTIGILILSVIIGYYRKSSSIMGLIDGGKRLEVLKSK